MCPYTNEVQIKLQDPLHSVDQSDTKQAGGNQSAAESFSD